MVAKSRAVILFWHGARWLILVSLWTFTKIAVWPCCWQTDYGPLSHAPSNAYRFAERVHESGQPCLAASTSGWHCELSCDSIHALSRWHYTCIHVQFLHDCPFEIGNVYYDQRTPLIVQALIHIKCSCVACGSKPRVTGTTLNDLEQMTWLSMCNRLGTCYVSYSEAGALRWHWWLMHSIQVTLGRSP